MTAPNLKNPTTITGKTECVGIGTTANVGILTNLQSSNKVLKINSVFAANVHTTNMMVTVSIANTVGTGFTTNLAKELINLGLMLSYSQKIKQENHAGQYLQQEKKDRSIHQMNIEINIIK